MREYRENTRYRFSKLCNEFIDILASPIETIKTGIRSFDNHTDGLFPGELVIIGGRPGSGKTSLLTSILLRIALGSAGAPKRCALWSGEMYKKELCSALYTLAFAQAFQQAGLAVPSFRKGEISADDVQRSFDRAPWFPQLPIEVDFDAGLDVEGIHAFAVDSEAEILFVDYVQLIRPDDTSQSREQQLAAISKGLMYTAKTLQIPVVIAAQLDRYTKDSQGLGRDGKPKPEPFPCKENLRESGQLEQDAHQILLVHRPANEDEYRTKPLILVDKYRAGETGRFRMSFDGPSRSFGNCDEPCNCQRCKSKIDF